jgi:hypothetical protein
MPPKTTKKGGALSDDVSKLVVPFGLLLAERGLNKMMKKEKKATKSSVEENKKAAVGGKKTKKTTKGGSGPSNGSQKLVHEFNQLSTEIENFLSKY